MALGVSALGSRPLGAGKAASVDPPVGGTLNINLGPTNVVRFYSGTTLGIAVYIGTTLIHRE